MFKWIKETLGVKPKKKYSQELMKATALYIQLVKSSIIESLCVEECLLVPETSSSNQKIPLMFALCSYFAARTDFELEQKFVSPDVREGVWSSIIDMVFEDMGIFGQAESVARTVILGQMGLVKGAIHHNKATANNAYTVSTLLQVLSNQKDSQTVLNISPSRVERLLREYEGYMPHLDAIIAEYYK